MGGGPEPDEGTCLTGWDVLVETESDDRPLDCRHERVWGYAIWLALKVQATFDEG